MQDTRYLSQQTRILTYGRVIKRGLPRVQSIFFAYTFVVYILVSVLRSNMPLLVLDALLAIALLQILSLKRMERIRVLGDSGLILIFVILYVVSILTGLIVDESTSWLSKIQGTRSLLFGIGFLILSSVWMNTVQRVDEFFRIYLIGALFAVLYGLRQLIFGLTAFEVNRLAQFGSIVNEIEVWGRTRIPSSFGDPATFAVVMMVAILTLPLIQFRSFLPKVVRRNYRLVFVLLLLGLLMTLVRAPLVALFVAQAFLLLVTPRRITRKVAVAVIIATILISTFIALNAIVISGAFAQSSSPLIRSLDNILTSVWSLIPSQVDLRSLTWQQRNLRTLSANYRQVAWQEGIAFVLDHPFGGGVGTMTESRRIVELTSVDTGWLRFGIEAGWLGLIGFLGLLFSVPWIAYKNLKRVADKNTRSLGYTLLAVWIGYAVASLGVPLFHTEILSAVAWTVAGILLNLDMIAKNSKAEGSSVEP